MKNKHRNKFMVKDLLDERSFTVLEKLGFKFLRDKENGRRLRIIKHQCQQ